MFDPPKINMPLNLPVVRTKLSYDSSIYVDKPIKTGLDALGVVERHIADSAGECAFAIACDIDFRPVCVTQVGLGSQMESTVSIRDIVRTALLSNASSIILVHNHPCGTANQKENRTKIKPSEKDLQLTQNLAKICPVVGILLYDSVIVQRPFNNNYLVYSMRHKSLLGKKWIPIKPKEFQDLLKGPSKEEDLLWQPLPESIQKMEQEHRQENKDSFWELE